MPAPYPLPQNITGIANLGQYANTVTDNLWGIGIIFVVGIICFTVFNLRFSNRVAVGGTSVMMSILTILWRFAGQISDQTMFTVIAISFLGILYLQFTRED